MEKDISSLEHTRWRCQYHVVFAPKYRRMSIFGEIRADIGKILRKLCEQKGVEIIERNTTIHLQEKSTQNANTPETRLRVARDQRQKSNPLRGGLKN